MTKMSKRGGTADMTAGINMLEIKDLQNILKVGKNSAYALMRSECFPSIQIGRKWLVSEEAFTEWLRDNKYSKILLDD